MNKEFLDMESVKFSGLYFIINYKDNRYKPTDKEYQDFISNFDYTKESQKLVEFILKSTKIKIDYDGSWFDTNNNKILFNKSLSEIFYTLYKEGKTSFVMDVNNTAYQVYKVNKGKYKIDKKQTKEQNKQKVMK